MGEARKCANCAAPVTLGSSRFCSFCGAELPALETHDSASYNPNVNLARRFASLEKHPDLERFLNYRPNTSGASNQMYGQAIGGLLFAGVSVFITVMFATVGGPIAIFPLLFVVFGLTMAFGGLKRSSSFRAAPLQRFRAAVIDERVKVSGGGKNSRASTTYYATLQTQEGQRTEFEVIEETASKVAAGDIGLAFVKGGILLDFLVVAA